MSEPWERPGVIETYTGGSFDLFAPDPEDVRLLDIAAGLAHICRFGGHSTEFYSVAHHSIHVSQELPDNNPRLELIGLFHDAGEAYIGDIPRPLKTEHELFEDMENQILEAVWESFGIEAPTDNEWKTVMAADDRLLRFEANNILQNGEWAGRSPDLGYELTSSSIASIREQFLSRSESLLDQI